MEERGRIKVGPAKCAGCGHGWINRLVDAGTLWGTVDLGGRRGGGGSGQVSGGRWLGIFGEIRRFFCLLRGAPIFAYFAGASGGCLAMQERWDMLDAE